MSDLKRSICGHIDPEAVLALARDLPGEGRPMVYIRKTCPLCMNGGWGYSYGRINVPGPEALTPDGDGMVSVGMSGTMSGSVGDPDPEPWHLELLEAFKSHRVRLWDCEAVIDDRLRDEMCKTHRMDMDEFERGTGCPWCEIEGEAE